MGLLSLSNILNLEKNEKWAVGAYDAPDTQVLLGILDAAEEDHAPVIVLIYPGMTSKELFPSFVSFVEKEVERRNIKVALVLDHGTSLDTIEAAINAGFTGVMIDSSSMPLLENIRMTKTVIEMAMSRNVSVEAELGYIGSGEDNMSITDRKKLYTNVEDAILFVEKTNVDALAVAIGSTHGVYKFEPEFDLDRLDEIHKAVNIPLVLHGSSGSPEKEIIGSIRSGIRKINVYTDMRMKVISEIRKCFDTTPNEKIDISSIDKIIREETKKVVKEKNFLFGSVGKADKYNEPFVNLTGQL